MTDRDDGEGAGASSGTQHTPPPAQSSQSSMNNFLPPGSGGDGGSAGTQTAEQETDIHKLNFPGDIPADVKTAILDYRPPDGYSISSIHNVKSKPSFICFWGVRVVKQLVVVDKKKKVWYKCMATHTCRASNKLLALSGSTTGATEHLKNVHDIESATSADDKKKKQDTLDKIDQVRQSKIYNSDKIRHNMLGFTKAFVVYAACSFRLAEQVPIRHYLGVMVPKDELEPARLNNKSVKRMIVEMYDATLKAVNKDLQQQLRAAIIAIVYVNCDIWTSKVSGEKFIGVRIFYIDSKGFVRTHLLAVKLFRPAPSIGKVTGQVVLAWFLQVLGQHGIPIERVAGAVTDGGGDVRTGIGQAVTRVWCGPHMLNRVIIDGTGMANTASQSKNLACRGLMETCKRVVQHVNRSQGFKIELEDTLEEASDSKRPKAKLSQAVSQRWISLCKMLFRILEQWDAIDDVYASHREKFPLEDLRSEMEEVYSMLSEFKAVIQYSQTTLEATAQKALEMTVSLLTDVLDPTEPLRVYHVASVGAEGGTIKHSDIDDADLTSVGRETRAALRKALVLRFMPRYGGELDAGGHLFDRTMLLSPDQRKLRYVDALHESAGREGGMRPVSAVKAKIKEEVTDLLVAAIEGIRASAPSGAEGGEPQAKRAKPTTTTSDASGAGNNDERRRRRRYCDDDDEGSDNDMNDTPVEDDPRKEAGTIMKDWLAAQIPTEEREENGAEYWRLHGKKHPFALRLVAQVVFGVPASAGVVERDFCIADMFMPRKRASLDPANLEMQLYLRAHFDRIPMDIPKLDDAAVAAAIPDRFKDPDAVKEVRVMDFMEEEKEVGVFDFVPDEEGEDVDGAEVDLTAGGEGVGGS